MSFISLRKNPAQIQTQKSTALHAEPEVQTWRYHSSGKVGDDFVGVIMSASLARQNGIDIPEKGKSEPESKPDTKKKK